MTREEIIDILSNLSDARIAFLRSRELSRTDQHVHEELVDLYNRSAQLFDELCDRLEN